MAALKAIDWISKLNSITSGETSCAASPVTVNASTGERIPTDVGVIGPPLNSGFGNGRLERPSRAGRETGLRFPAFDFLMKRRSGHNQVAGTHPCRQRMVLRQLRYLGYAEMCTGLEARVESVERESPPAVAVAELAAAAV